MKGLIGKLMPMVPTQILLKNRMVHQHMSTTAHAVRAKPRDGAQYAMVRGEPLLVGVGIRE